MLEASFIRDAPGTLRMLAESRKVGYHRIRKTERRGMLT